MAKLWALVAAVDRYVAPIYRIVFLTSVLIAAVSAIIYYLSFLGPLASGWLGDRWEVIGQVTLPDPKNRLLVSLVAGLLTGLIFIFTRISVVQRARIHITNEFRRCVEEHIRYLDEVHSIIVDDDLSHATTVSMISERSRNHSIFLCSRLAEIFELVTYCQCHASIKTFNTENSTIITRTRDALSHNIAREDVDEALDSYQYRKNTAFAEIIDSPKVDFYLNNHLRLSSWIGRYENANQDWNKHYLATVVMPVTLSKNPSQINASTVIGFVCVDNMCGHFTKRYSKAVLGVFVALITDMMVKLGEMETISQEGPNG